MDEIKTFIYNPNGENRERNSLNHSEVIKLFSTFLLTKPLMQRILVEKFPFLLIDESQDTNKALIEALLAVQRTHADRFSLGLIGDTMQRIYADGKERIEAEIPDSWATPGKKLNHRCPKRIVRLINRVREQADYHVQEPRDDRIEGWVRLFVFPADVADKPALEDRVREYMVDVTGDRDWSERAKCKTLALEHHMAATRMGFQSMFEVLSAVDGFRTSLLDGTLEPTRFFTHSILPLVIAQKMGDKFTTAKIIRERSPLLSKDRLKSSDRPIDQLRSAQRAVDGLMALLSEREPTCGELLECIAETNLFDIPDSLKAALAARRAGPDQASDDEQQDPLEETVRALVGFLECGFSVIQPYASYVAREASFDTHQGVKGLEFDRVMVVMDDGEARGLLFGYEKLLGAKAPTQADLKNRQAGKETSVDRTRRLFYVTCSRAKSSLALVAYSADPEAVRAHVVGNGWFAEDEVVLGLV